MCIILFLKILSPQQNFKKYPNQNLLIMKRSCIAILLFISTLCYGQKTTLIQNINFRAKELKHHLNKSGDSLVLSSDNVIYKVEIFNNDFTKSFEINDTAAKIPLAEIPKGRFVTEVKVNQKLIILTLIRHKDISLADATPDLSSDNSEVNLAASFNPHEGKEKQLIIPIKVAKFFWVIKKINKGHSSSKITKLADKETVEKMIEQHKIDQKSKAGRLNMLTIWEVYDTSAFLRHKRINPNDYTTKDAEFFNSTPFYDSKPQKEITSS